jgi:penicillin-binding protein 2
VTSDGQGTAHSAKVKGIDVAGKTGTAQWGPTDRQRIAAWFTGFMPAAEPRYAFTALYEGEPNDQSVHGGSHAAPLIGKAFREIYHPKKVASKEAATLPVATTPILEDESNAAPEPVPVDQSN